MCLPCTNVLTLFNLNFFSRIKWDTHRRMGSGVSGMEMRSRLASTCLMAGRSLRMECMDKHGIRDSSKCLLFCTGSVPRNLFQNEYNCTVMKQGFNSETSHLDHIMLNSETGHWTCSSVSFLSKI